MEYTSGTLNNVIVLRYFELLCKAFTVIMSAPAKPNILCVGLACIDIVTVCESFPLEDSDHRLV